MKIPALFFFLTVLLSGCAKVGEALNQQGVAAFNQHRFRTAARDFHWASFFQNRDAVNLNDEGYALYSAKDYDGADRAFRRAVELSRDEKLNFQIQLNQALLHCDQDAILGHPARKDWLPQGIGIFQKLVLADPGDSELRMRLGFAQIQNGNPGGGFLQLDKACRLATPEQVARYTSHPVEGCLLILRQIQEFYIKIRYFKKADEVSLRIAKLERSKPGPIPAITPTF